jgi:transposase
MTTRVGIDAHKKSCTVCVFKDDDALLTSTPSERFVFKTTMQGLAEFMEKVPEGSTTVIESSTTGKAISRLLSGRYNVHMIAPPEKKQDIKTDKRDAERIVKEDMLGYVRRSYIPSPQIEELRLVVSKQMEIAGKIAAVKNQVHALLERNLLQSGFEDVSDIFGAEGLERLSSLELPKNEGLTLAMHLEELRLYTSHYRQVETEMAKIAGSDSDCQLLMSHPGIGPFVAVAIKARTGDASRFPTKKHFCSYAGVVPRADNSGERVSEHRSVKHGDDVLKYALTCGVIGAVRARTDSAVKRFYLKQIARGKSPQDAEVAAARKLACTVWKILTSKQRYADEDRYLTARKMRTLSQTAGRSLKHATKPEDVPTLIDDLRSKVDALEKCRPEEGHRVQGDRRGRRERRSKPSIGRVSEARGVAR